MKTRALHAETGFTLVEVLLAATIVLLALGASMGVQSQATSLMHESAARNQLQDAASTGTKEVAYDVRWCDATSLIVSSLNGSSRLDLRIPVDYVANAPVWSTTITYEVVPSPIDSNRNGVADTWRLVRIQDGQTRVLCDHIVAGGFTATVTAATATLQLRLARDFRGRPMTATVSTTVNLRNRG